MPQTPGVMDALVHQLRDLATSLRAAEEALPDEIRGTDGTGAVAVSLGRAGDVTGIDVDSDWSAHLGPTALGTAVVEAAGVAGQERMRAMARAPTDAPVRSQEPAPERWAVPELADGMVVPPLEDLAEQAISALHSAASSARALPPAPSEVVGAGADGRVTLGLCAGALTRCEIDRSGHTGVPARRSPWRSTRRSVPRAPPCERRPRPRRNGPRRSTRSLRRRWRTCGHRTQPAGHHTRETTVSEVFVVTEALRKEAGTWDEQAVLIRSAATRAEVLRLTRLTAGIFNPIVSEYEATIDAVTARCLEGEREMTAIASALLRNADAYDSGDVEASQHVADAY